MMQLTIVGLGNQAKSWAKNLQDSNFPVRVALRPNSPSFESAIHEGFKTIEIGSEDFYNSSAFALLTPDHTHHDFMLTHGHRLQKGSIILYAHGFSLLKHQFQNLYPHLNHVLFAPKSIGSELRKQYQVKGKLGAVYSFEHVKENLTELEAWLLKLSSSLGINMGPYKTSFERETQADLYSEQGLLCSLIPYVASNMFTHMVESGLEPELAYFECWHELKLIVSAMVDKGPEGFFELISPNALVGSEKGYTRLITPEFQKNMRNLFEDIKLGKFNNELDRTNIEELRKKIKQRWHNEPLTSTFQKINQVKE